MVLAPEHPLVSEITSAEQKDAVEEYIKSCASKSDLERGDLNKNKSGIFTGATATNPVNGEQIPVWIADYVMMGYGTGAIMAVPAHDQRDIEFAQANKIAIKQVVAREPLSDELIANYLNESKAHAAQLNEEPPIMLLAHGGSQDMHEVNVTINGSHSAFFEHGYAVNSCLLYTSPSPRDKRQSRMPSSA